MTEFFHRSISSPVILHLTVNPGLSSKLGGCIRSEMYRIRELHIWEEQQQINEVVSLVQDVSAPILETLEVHPISLFNLPGDFLNGGSPCLRNLSLHLTQIDCCSPILQNLTRLALHGVTFRGSSSESLNIYNLLTQIAPTIEDLELFWLEPPFAISPTFDPPPPSRTVALPALSKLSIAAHATMSAFFLCHIMPTKPVNLVVTVQFHQVEDLTPLIGWLACSLEFHRQAHRPKLAAASFVSIENALILGFFMKFSGSHVSLSLHPIAAAPNYKALLFAICQVNLYNTLPLDHVQLLILNNYPPTPDSWVLNHDKMRDIRTVHLTSKLSSPWSFFSALLINIDRRADGSAHAIGAIFMPALEVISIHYRNLNHVAPDRRKLLEVVLECMRVRKMVGHEVNSLDVSRCAEVNSADLKQLREQVGVVYE